MAFLGGSRPPRFYYEIWCAHTAPWSHQLCTWSVVIARGNKNPWPPPGRSIFGDLVGWKRSGPRGPYLYIYTYT
eukprot:8439689-Pyramimonas_sp.AAC.1